MNALIFRSENLGPINFYITRFYCTLILLIILVFSYLPTARFCLFLDVLILVDFELLIQSLKKKMK
jgi:hypothetical protein